MPDAEIPLMDDRQEHVIEVIIPFAPEESG